MKNLIKQIINGFGTGIGIGLAVLLVIFIVDTFQERNFNNQGDPFAFDPEAFVSGEGNLIADNSMTDLDLMAIASGHWWGLSWDPREERLDLYSWNGNQEGDYVIDFHYISENRDDVHQKETGIWWIKKPYQHTQTDDYEITYKILYLSKDHFVYQTVMKGGFPVPNGRVFVISRVPALIESLEKLSSPEVM